jgi:hypothetical protein
VRGITPSCTIVGRNPSHGRESLLCCIAFPPVPTRLPIARHEFPRAVLPADLIHVRHQGITAATGPPTRPAGTRRKRIVGVAPQPRPPGSPGWLHHLNPGRSMPAAMKPLTAAHQPPRAVERRQRRRTHSGRFTIRMVILVAIPRELRRRPSENPRQIVTRRVERLATHVPAIHSSEHFRPST